MSRLSPMTCSKKTRPVTGASSIWVNENSACRIEIWSSNPSARSSGVNGSGSRPSHLSSRAWIWPGPNRSQIAWTAAGWSTAAKALSISGLFAHFGSKEELQLATVEWADAIFDAQVIQPASSAHSGLDRLRRLADSYLRYVEADIFPGGCFFASAMVETTMPPGPVRD